ncbi:MAG TPA: transcription elongation factor Spt5 [Nitrososphaerales archaeon]|nr:transcription elongation factor Spt5 [Nitrososphaerales archaeon]NSL74472.1 transcription elongation factor Spt5 [Nitrososphaerota archaeon]HIC84279.1 transcription elongation factor Spt5 [Nitrososphaerales archaeon]HIM82867.1 transcription elongation factor Spt5 [Nitrososphaerales archaeon]
MSTSIQSRFFAVKTTGGQERNVAKFVGNRLERNETENSVISSTIRSIVVIDSLKGYVFFEAPNAQVVSDAISGFKHVKNMIPGIVPYEDIEKFLVTRSIVSEISINDIVEITSGPFKNMKAKISRVEAGRSEVTIMLLDAPYQLPVTIDVNGIRIVEKSKGDD